jgi:hypothetical protein
MSKRTCLLSLLILTGLILIVILAFQWIIHIPTKQEKRANQIINSFMESKGIQAEPGSEEYRIIMRKIIWGEYPELTGEDSKFIENPDELDCVFDYAWQYSGYKELYGGDDEPDIWEASPYPPEAIK